MEPSDIHQPTDDAGSETQSRFDFQLLLTTYACVEMLSDEDVVEVICEWDEDYVVVRQSTRHLVSVKHLEPSSGPWTLAGIVERGGVGHLLERWRTAQEACRCTLLTNGGLKTGPHEAAALSQATTEDDRQSCAEWAWKKLGAQDIAEATRFMRALTIRAELPKRDDLRASLLVDHLPAHAAVLGWPEETWHERFDAIHALVWQAAKSDIRSQRRSLLTDGTLTDAAARALAKKTITRERVLHCLARTPHAAASALVKKLERGGLGPTEVERCKRLRHAWLSHDLELAVALPDQPDGPRARLLDVIHELSADAESSSRRPGEQYAASMRTDLSARIDAAIQEGRLTCGREHALGLVYDLTDRCMVWWSDRFDVGAADR